MNMEDICETGPTTVYSPYPRRLESLTFCGFNYKGSTFSSVLVRSAQPTEPPVRGYKPKSFGMESVYQHCRNTKLV